MSTAIADLPQPVRRRVDRLAIGTFVIGAVVGYFAGQPARDDPARRVLNRERVLCTDQFRDRAVATLSHVLTYDCHPVREVPVEGVLGVWP